MSIESEIERGFNPQEFLADLDQVNSIKMDELAWSEVSGGETAEMEEVNSGQKYWLMRQELFDLLDKNDLSADERVALIRTYYLRMVNEGMIAPRDHPLAGQVREVLKKRIVKQKRLDFDSQIQTLDRYLRDQGYHEEVIAEVIAERIFDEQQAEAEAAEEAVVEFDKYGLKAALEIVRAINEQRIKQQFRDHLEKRPTIAVSQRETPVIGIDNQMVVTGDREEEVGGRIGERDEQSELDQRLRKDFADGNFLFHSTSVAAALKIVEEGELVNSLALHRRGVELNGSNYHSGEEGISWSLNAIEALPGDRGHLVGLMVNLPDVLRQGRQLAVPARPAPYEVVQIPEKIDVDDFYRLKVQEELYDDWIAMGEKNSVSANLAFFAPIGSEVPGDSLLNDLYQSQPDWQQLESEYERLFEVDAAGQIVLSEQLYEQRSNEIPVAAVFLTALVKTGLLRQLPSFSDCRNLMEVMNKFYQSSQPIALRQEIFREFQSQIFGPGWEKEKKYGEQLQAISQPLEQMYLVVPDHDWENWQAVLARSKHRPRGVILYNGQEIKLENFASRHSGDHNKLTQRLRELVPAQDREQGGIDYGRDLIGQEVDQVARGGQRGQVLAEKEIVGRRRVIRQNNEGELQIF